MQVENYYQIIIGILVLYWVTDLISALSFRGLYKERNQLLGFSNEIRKLTYVEKYKPQIRVTPPPNPWDNKEHMTKDQVLEFGDNLRKGKGVWSLFHGGKKK